MIETTLALSLALGAMNAPLATTAQLKTVSQVPPAPAAAGPTVPNGVWLVIIQLALDYGKYAPPTAGSPAASYTLAASHNDPQAEYMYMSVSPIGTINANGQFRVAGVEFHALVRGKAAAGPAKYDHWSFSVGSNGKLKSAARAAITKMPDGKVEQGAPVDLDLADPEVKARFDSVIGYWAAR